MTTTKKQQLFNFTEQEAILKFKQDWEGKDFKRVQDAIVKHFSYKALRYDAKLPAKVFYTTNFDALDKFFGFAYSSTGICAVYGISNVSVVYNENNQLYYAFFLIDDNDKVWAELHDKEGKEFYLPL